MNHFDTPMMHITTSNGSVTSLHQLPQPLQQQQQQQFTAGGVEPTTTVPSMNGAATVLPQSPQQFAQQQQQQQAVGAGAAVPGYTYATAVGIGWAHTAPATFTNSAISSATSRPIFTPFNMWKNALSNLTIELKWIILTKRITTRISCVNNLMKEAWRVMWSFASLSWFKSILHWFNSRRSISKFEI